MLEDVEGEGEVVVPVLKARYEEVGGWIREGGRHDSVWWKTVCCVREGVGEGVGNWFEDNTRWVVGDGQSTLFWYDRCGAYFVTEFLRKIFWLTVVFFLQPTPTVQLGVPQLSQLYIFFFIAKSHASFGLKY